MSQKDIKLYAGNATPKNIILRALPVAAAAVGTTIFLYAGNVTPNNIVLGDPTVVRGGGPVFPTQFSGFKIQKTGSTIELCLVAEADAPSGMGGVIKINKNGTIYALYLVETSDGDASPVRVRTGTGTKAVRLKT